MIKTLLLYFVEFKKDGTILPKEYLDDYIVEDLNEQPIIIIIHDKSIFSTNNSCQKVCIFENMEFFVLKKKKRYNNVRFFSSMVPA